MITPPGLSHGERFPREALDDETSVYNDLYGTDSDGSDSARRQGVRPPLTQLRADIDAMRYELTGKNRGEYLTPAEEVQLSEIVQDGISAEQEALSAPNGVATPEQQNRMTATWQAREKLFMANMPFALFCARASCGILPADSTDFRPPALPGDSRTYVGTYENISHLANPRADLEDRTQMALEAMWKATLDYKPDPDKKARFITYAAWRIQSFLDRQSFQESGGWDVPHHLADRYIEALRHEKEFGVSPAVVHRNEEGGLRDGLHPTVVFEGRRSEPLGNISFPIPEESDAYEESPASLADVTHCEQPTAAQEVFSEYISGELRKVLDSLPNKRMADVIMMRYGLDDGRPKTLDEIAKCFGVTRERIRQIESKALSYLRHPSLKSRLSDALGEDVLADRRVRTMGHGVCSAPNVITTRSTARKSQPTETPTPSNDPDREPWQAYPDEDWNAEIRANINNI